MSYEITEEAQIAADYTKAVSRLVEERGESLDFFGSGTANVVDMREWATVMAMSNDEICELADQITEQMED